MKALFLKPSVVITLLVFSTIHAIELRGRCNLPGFACDVELKDSCAYVATDSGLCVVDSRQPDAPVLRSFVPLPGYGNELAILDNYAFVTDGSEKAVQIVDITDPDHPAVAGAFGDGCGYVWGVHVGRKQAGKPACCAVASIRGMMLFDISQPRSPVKVGEYVPYYTGSAGISSDVPFKLFDERNEIPHDTSIRFHPPEGCIPSLDDERAYMVKTDDVFIDGNTVYVLYYDNGRCGTGLYLKTIDISQPQAPRCIDSIGLYAWGCGFTVSSGKAYIAHALGFDIVEGGIAAPFTLLKSYRYPGYKEDVAVSVDYAYISCTVGLQVTAVNNLETAQPFNPIEIPGGCRGIAVSGRYVYVASGDSGLSVLSGMTSTTITPTASRALRPTPLRVHATGSGVRFTIGNEVSMPVSLRIYTLQGQPITTISGRQHSFAWDGTDEAGTKAPRGMYIACMADSVRILGTALVVLR